MFWPYLISRQVRDEHYDQISHAILAAIDDTDDSYFSHHYRAQWFFMMRMAIHNGDDTLFLRIKNIVKDWWLNNISQDEFCTINGDTKRFFSEYLNKMYCYTAISEFRQKQEVSLTVTHRSKTTYWDAMLLGLGGANKFSVEIAEHLWLAFTDIDSSKYWKGALRLFSWNYRGYLFLASKDFDFSYIPYLDNSDAIPVIDNKYLVDISGNKKHSIFEFSYAAELIYRLMSSYLSYDSETQETLKDEVASMSEQFNDTVIEMNGTASGRPISVFFFHTLSRCLSARPEGIRYNNELQLAVNNVLDALHLLVIPDSLIAPYPEEESTFVSSIISKSKTDKGSWLLPYCLSRRPELSFWLSKCNTKNQVEMIITHLNTSPYDALPIADEKRTKFLMNILCKA